jgi:hypothetical protein
MKKLAFFMILFSWIISVTAVFSFPSESFFPTKEFSLYSSFSIEGKSQISTNVTFIEVPDFKIDQKLFGNFIEDLKIDFTAIENSLLINFLSENGSSLFDIQTLFIHFFYPW